MMRVAVKLGFTQEGSDRETLQWRGAWLDLHHFGLLRREWESGPR
jgi:RimJ/RimL family protein N-acetyltransferase